MCERCTSELDQSLAAVRDSYLSLPPSVRDALWNESVALTQHPGLIHVIAELALYGQHRILEDQATAAADTPPPTPEQGAPPP